MNAPLNWSKWLIFLGCALIREVRGMSQDMQEEDDPSELVFSLQF